MTEQDNPRPRTFSVIGYGLALEVAVLGLVARAVVAHDDGTSVLPLILAAILVLLFALFEMFAKAG